MFNLRESIAASVAFRTWTGTADVAAARERIYYGAAPGDVGLPHAVIQPSDELGKRRSGTGLYVYREGSALEVIWTGAKDPDDTFQQALMRHQNDVDSIVDNLEENSAAGGYFSFPSWNTMEGPYVRAADSDQGATDGEVCETMDSFDLEGW